MPRNSPPIAWTVLQRSEKLGLLLVMLLYFLGSLLDILFVALTMPLISILNSGMPPTILKRFFNAINLEDFFIANPIFVILLLLLFALLLRLIVRLIAAQMETSMKSKIASRLSSRLHQLYLAKPLEFHSQENSAFLITDVLNTRQIADSIYEPWLRIGAESASILFILIFLIVLSPKATFLGFILLLILVFVYQRIVGKVSHRLGQVTLEAEKYSLSLVKETLWGITEIKLYAKEKFFSEKFARENETSIIARNKNHRLQALTPLYLEFSGFLVAFCLISLFLWANGESRILLPLLGAFVVALFRLIPSFSSLYNSIQRLRFGAALVNRPLTVLQDGQSNNRSLKLKLTDIGTNFTSLDLIDVSFTYAGSEREVVSNISLSIEHGTFTGIIGESGSGKSTIANIILGLLKPTEGLVQIRSLSQNKEGTKPIHLGYVPQTVHLFDLSISENVAFGISKDDIDREKVMTALSAAKLDHLPGLLPSGLDTIIGENGTRLSGGERQRLGLARALYLNPQILVLDEATSSLDSKNERDLIELLRDLRGEITTIFVTHRLDAIKECDELFLIRDGKLVAQGLPDDVLSRYKDSLLES